MPSVQPFDEFTALLRAKAPNSVRPELDGNLLTVVQKLASKKSSLEVRDFAAGVAKEEITLLRNAPLRNDLESRVLWYVAAMLVKAAAHRFTDNDRPGVHHWLPICYARRFDARQPENYKKLRSHKSRSVGVSYLGAKAKRVVHQNLTFAHEKTVHGGFYQGQLEWFFSLIEANYAEAEHAIRRGAGLSSFSAVSLTAMMLVQQLRAPAKDGRFKVRDFNQFVTQLPKLVKNIVGYRAIVVESELPLPFTAKNPVRSRVLANGELTYSFPLSSHLVLVLSQSKLNKATQQRIVVGGRAAVIATARRKKRTLYGVEPGDV